MYIKFEINQIIFIKFREKIYRIKNIINNNIIKKIINIKKTKCSNTCIIYFYALSYINI